MRPHSFKMLSQDLLRLPKEVLKKSTINRENSILQSQIIKAKCNGQKHLIEISTLSVAMNKTELKPYYV